MAKVYVEFEEPESCSKCPLFYATEGAFSDVCQLLNESDERVNTLKEKFSDCPLKKVEERENKLRQSEEGEIVCIKHYEAIKNFPILKEQVEDWKADHEHNLELMKGLNERIAELEKENDCYKALESHYDEIEEDAKAIAKENEELKKNVLVWHKVTCHEPDENGYITDDNPTEEGKEYLFKLKNGSVIIEELYYEDGYIVEGYSWEEIEAWAELPEV